MHAQITQGRLAEMLKWPPAFQLFVSCGLVQPLFLKQLSETDRVTRASC